MVFFTKLFSRAEYANQINTALAAEGGSSYIPASCQSFSAACLAPRAEPNSKFRFAILSDHRESKNPHLHFVF